MLSKDMEMFAGFSFNQTGTKRLKLKYLHVTLRGTVLR